MDIGIDYNDLSNLILAIGACLALIGATLIYKKWSMGQKNIENDILLWGGGILVLLIAQFFVRAMFGEVI